MLEKTGRNTMGNGKKDSEVAMVLHCCPMGRNIWAIGKTTCTMDKESTDGTMENGEKVNGAKANGFDG